MLEAREGEHVEYKLLVNDNAVKTIVAFANTAGGTLYIGVDDEGNAVGLDDADAELLRLGNLLHHRVRPDILMMTSCSIEKMDGADVIVVQVDRGVRRPYYLAEKGLRPEGVYVRSGSATIPSSDTAILCMVKETEGDSFEARISMNQDLTFEYASSLFAARGLGLSPDEMRTLGMTDAEGLFTNLALLLSDQCPPYVKAASFDDDERDVFIKREEYSGCLLKQLDDAYAFLEDSNRYRTHMEGLHRVDYYDYPAVALREALVNSVAHREFALSGPTLVSVMPSSIEIVSLGGLPLGIEYPDLEANISMPRNKLLAGVMFRLELIEAYGTGIARMRRGYRDAGCTVGIEVTPNTFTVSLPNRNACDLPNNMLDREVPRFDYAMINLETGEELPLEEFFASGPHTRQEFQEEFGMTQSTAIRTLKVLLDEGLLKRVGKGKATRYHLK